MSRPCAGVLATIKDMARPLIVRSSFKQQPEDDAPRSCTLAPLPYTYVLRNAIYM